MRDFDVVLTLEDAVRLNVVLTKIIDKARIDCVMLINKSGRLITAQSETSEFDKTALAALVAGSFASTTAIANMIGEKEFASMYHQGQKKNTFITLVDDTTILTALFDKRTTLDKIRHFLKEYSEELRGVLAKFYSNIESSPELNIDIGTGNDFSSEHWELPPSLLE